MTVVTDDESRNNTLFGDFVTTLARKDVNGTAELPQAFFYEIRNAKDGKCWGGLQIWATRCYFERKFKESWRVLIVKELKNREMECFMFLWRGRRTVQFETARS